MGLHSAKRIADPVHGTLALSEVETRIISSRVFQRLRNVKQLGLAYFVFPGADYSRFAHSLGVCHLTGRILEALNLNGNAQIDNKEIQLYRVAALLHDIGHYPYSHATEEAIDNYYSASLVKPRSAALENESLLDEELDCLPSFLGHEDVGQEVVIKDPELSQILCEAGIDPEEVCSIFTRKEPPRFANLISSDLDADRIDYLLRTAHHTGLPYGSVDIDYLLSQMRVDKNERICLTTKALRAADHLLLCRYFDYQQVNFHKAVAGFELILKDSIGDLLEAKKIDFSAEAVSKAIQEGTWCDYDDSFVLQKIRELYREVNSGISKDRGRAILERKPPKLLAEVEFIAPRKKQTVQDFRLKKQILKAKISEWASEFNLDKNLWYLWDRSIALTKVGSHAPISALVEGQQDMDKYEQAVRILNEPVDNSIPIMESQYSLMSVLANYALYSLRVYVLLRDTDQANREAMQKRIENDLPDFDWK